MPQPAYVEFKMQKLSSYDSLPDKGKKLLPQNWEGERGFSTCVSGFCNRRALALLDKPEILKPQRVLQISSNQVPRVDNLFYRC